MQIPEEHVKDEGTWIHKQKRTSLLIVAKRPLTPTYIVFYILFLPDSWQILMGLILAWLIHPLAMTPEMVLFKRLLIFLMLATIGYTATRIPGRWIAGRLQKWILR